VRVAGRFISLSVLFWLFDGLIQFIFGRDLFGIPMADRGAEPDRITIFFVNQSFGYYIAFFSIFPIIWFLRPGKFPVVSVIIASVAGVVTFAAGSRYAMVGYFVGIALLLFLLVPQQTRSLRIWFLALVPFIPALLAGSYAWNESFRSRVDQTFIIFQRLDFPSLNHALSYRLEIWSPAWSLIGQHWLFGIGPGQFREAMLSLLPASSWHAQGGLKVMHAHQVLLEIALGTGIVGVACFVLYYIYIGSILWRYRQLLSTRQAFKLSGIIVFLLMWLPFGTQTNFYGSDQIFFTFYFLALSFGPLAASSGQQICTPSPPAITSHPL
jgi:O-antigen ligase